jgi:hypothetical protein
VWAEFGSLQTEERQALLFFRANGPDLYLSRPGGTYGRSDVVFFKNLQGYVARRASILKVETSDGGRSGRVSFRLTRGADEVESHWPAELAGELSWTCGTWLGSGAFQAAREGRLDIRLAGVDWVPSGATTRCDLEAGGSVRELSAYGVGSLQRKLVSLHVDLRAEHRVGSEVLASVFLVGSDPPGEQLPWWQGRVRLADVAGSDRAGRATFVDMPSAIDPTGAPVTPGWPDKLSGEFSWTCG